MSWVDKAHKEYQIQKIIKQIMNSKEFQDAKKKDMEQSALRGLAHFTLIGCLYMELNFRCRRKGLLKFIEFVKGNVEEVGKDNDLLKASNQYFKDKYEIDVMRELGMAFEEDEDEQN